jgi:hypothetical protein
VVRVAWECPYAFADSAGLHLGFFAGCHNTVSVLSSLQGDHDRRPNSFLVYAPSRTCAVYGPAEWADTEADRKPAGIPGLGVKELGPYYEY